MKSRDTALAELTLRKYERPFNLKGRDLVSKLCLSIGLLQPGDSRDIIVDILTVLLRNKKSMTSKEVEEKVIAMRKKHKLPMVGIASSNLRRQIKRLRDLYLIEKIANTYRVTEKEQLVNIYNDKIEKFLLKSLQERVKEYFQAVDSEFFVKKNTQKSGEEGGRENIEKNNRIILQNEKVESNVDLQEDP